MQTVKTGKDFTGYVLIRSKSLGIAKRAYVGKWFYRGYQDDGVTPLTFDQRHPKVEFAGRLIDAAAYGKPIYGRLAPAVACGIKCMSAVGPSCDCSCEGKNHGGGW